MKRESGRRSTRKVDPYIRRSAGTALIAVLVLMASVATGQVFAQEEPNNLNVMSSTGFTQAFVRSECPDQTPCQDDAFAILSNSAAECFGEFDDPVSHICTAYAWSELGWGMNGLAGNYPPPPPPGGGGCGNPNGSMIDFRGERVSPDVFTLSGHMSHNFGPDTATGEIAVFRYAGDPEVFEGLELASVADLVSLGLIGGADVLYVESCENTYLCDIDVDIEVTGLSDDEIVLFVAIDGPIPEYEVPALTGVGLVLMGLTMLGLGTRAVRARSPRNR